MRGRSDSSALTQACTLCPRRVSRTLCERVSVCARACVCKKPKWCSFSVCQLHRGKATCYHLTDRCHASSMLYVCPCVCALSMLSRVWRTVSVFVHYIEISCLQCENSSTWWNGNHTVLLMWIILYSIRQMSSFFPKYCTMLSIAYFRARLSSLYDSCILILYRTVGSAAKLSR